MALPTGSGSEILKRAAASYSTGSTTTILTAPALHIYTILSVSINRDGATAVVATLTAHNGSADIRLVQESLSEETFVWNDRLVLMSGDSLKLGLDSVYSVNYWVSYIDQNWED